MKTDQDWFNYEYTLMLCALLFVISLKTNRNAEKSFNIALVTFFATIVRQLIEHANIFILDYWFPSQRGRFNTINAITITYLIFLWIVQRSIKKILRNKT